MPYKIQVTHHYFESGYFVVEAETEEEAQQIAKEAALEYLIDPEFSYSEIVYSEPFIGAPDGTAYDLRTIEKNAPN